LQPEGKPGQKASGLPSRLFSAMASATLCSATEQGLYVGTRTT